MTYHRHVSGQEGQTTTEYLMILGLVTAIIITLERLVIPVMRWVVTVLVSHMATCISSVYPVCVSS